MILGKKIIAIRACADDMTREEFAGLAGISVDALTNVEQNRPYHKRTEALILRAVDNLGYSLTENGIEETQKVVICLETYTELLEDIRLNLPKDVLFLNADDRKSSSEVNTLTEELVGSTRCKFLCPIDADTFAFPDKAKYRKSALLGTRDVAIIYGERLGLYTPNGIMVIRNRWISEDYRKQFTTLWEVADDI